jgi:protein PsiE
MILQGKGISTIDLIYEGCAVLLLAISTLVIQYGLGLSKNKDEKE